MSKFRAFRPSLTAFESRLTPAVNLIYTGSHLTVIGDEADNTITLQTTAAGDVNVNTGVNLGTYRVTGNVTVRGNNGADVVTVDLDTNAQPLPGNLRVDLGLGDDALVVDGSNIAGDLRAVGGTGDDGLILGGAAALAVGGSLFWNGNSGLNSVVATDLDVAGGVVLTNAETVLWTDSTAAGYFVVNNALATAAGFLSMSGAVEIGGNFTYIGSGNAESLFLDGALNSEVVLSLGNGDNSMDLAATTVVGGSLTYLGGNGIDSLTPAPGAQVFGNMNLNTGHGDNVYTMNTAFIVAGDLTVNGGNGNDEITGFDGEVFGRFVFNAGHGTNTLELFTGFIAGDVTYNGGSGVDEVVVAMELPGHLRVFLGAGSDTFTWDLSGRAGSAYIDFGVDFDADLYDDTPHLIDVTWDQTLLNLA